MIDAELQAHGSTLGNLRAALQLQSKAIGALPDDLGSPDTRQRIDDFRIYNAMVGDLTEEIGSKSSLDLEALKDLCDNVIREAREDLRGQHGPGV